MLFSNLIYTQFTGKGYLTSQQALAHMLARATPDIGKPLPTRQQAFANNHPKTQLLIT